MDGRFDSEAWKLARRAATGGERVLWAGRAGPRRLLDWGLAQPVLLLAVFAAAVWAGMGDAWGRIGGRWWVIAVLMLPALPLLARLALALRDVGREGRDAYAVTDRRVLILARDGAVRHAVGLARAGEFKLIGRTLHLGGEAEAYRKGKGDLDGGLRRFEALPKLERLAEPERVLAIIRGAAGG